MYMSVFLLIVCIVSTLILIWVSSVRISTSGYSAFELKRRAVDDPHMRRVWARDQKVPALQAVLMLKRLFLVVVTAWLAVLAIGWLWGVLWMIVFIFLLRPLSRFGIVHRPSQRLFDRIESWILGKKAFTKIAPLLARGSDTQHRAFHSREELAHSIERSGDILTGNEKKLLNGALMFRDKTVKQIMTPKKDMVTVSAKEFLGPLVLSELHKSGHSRLPVIAKDVHHVVGVLYLQDLLSLNNKKSLTAEKAMDPKVHYVDQNDSLETALGIFLRSHHHLCIVLDRDGQTVGLITIEDVLEALIGRKLLDEDDLTAAH
jgi:CBS domain containing-hemolysin-like protein